MDKIQLIFSFIPNAITVLTLLPLLELLRRAYEQADSPNGTP
jgi:hypothetical protein